jgi:hypothetical protein
MSNTLQGLNLSQVASQTLDHLGLSFPMFAHFARNFSDTVRQHGESVVTRIPAVLSAQDLSGGYTPGDVSSTQVEIELDHMKGFVIGLSDLEISKARSADFVFNIFTRPAVDAVAKSFADSLLGLITPSNFPTAITKSAADFDTDEIAQAQQLLSTAKAPKSMRSILLGTDYTASLMKDSMIYSDQYGSRDPLLTGEVMDVFGMGVVEYQGIPTANNLRGFACHPSALVMAARHVAEPSTGGRVETISTVEPRTGLPVQFRQHYDATLGKTMLSVSCLWGVALGNTTCGVRILTP